MRYCPSIAMNRSKCRGINPKKKKQNAQRLPIHPYSSPTNAPASQTSFRINTCLSKSPSRPIDAPSLVRRSIFNIYTDIADGQLLLIRMLTLSPMYTLGRPDHIVIRECHLFASLI